MNCSNSNPNEDNVHSVHEINTPEMLHEKFKCDICSVVTKSNLSMKRNAEGVHHKIKGKERLIL